MENAIQILIGSLMLSLVHASIPNHWLPLVAISKTESWSHRETAGITAIAGASHITSSILIGIVVGLIGYKLSSSYEFITKIFAPLVLIVLGIIYIFLDLRNSNHHHHPHNEEIENISKKSKTAIIITLSVAMFFSPCIELEAYYFTAGTKMGWMGIILVSIIYFLVTVSAMVLFVNLGRRGLELINWHFLEHNERKIAGTLLIILGIFAYLIEI